MKRYVYLPARTVSVEDGTVRDLDGTVLGEVGRGGPGVARHMRKAWYYATPGGLRHGPHRFCDDAIAALLADPSCPTPGPNRYDK